MDFRGQGTTEYLIILAVVIVIALVVVGVMGWFPGLSTGITESQSKAYWLGASPLAVTDWQITSTATDATFSMRNMTTDVIQVTEITVDGTAIIATDVNIAAGSTTNVTGTTGKACASGSAYQYNMAISYDVINGISGKTQTGQKPLVATCP
jgi:hypothetical protein